MGRVRILECATTEKAEREIEKVLKTCVVEHSSISVDKGKFYVLLITAETFGGIVYGPDCPVCGEQMTKRRRIKDGGAFWGCSMFPDCKGIVDYSEELERPQVSYSGGSGDSDEIPF